MPHKTIIRLSGVARNPANGFPARLLGYILIPHRAAVMILVAEQQDAGVGLLLGCLPSPEHQRFQFLLFLLRQPHAVFLHHHIPPLPNLHPMTHIPS